MICMLYSEKAHLAISRVCSAGEDGAQLYRHVEKPPCNRLKNYRLFSILICL